MAFGDRSRSREISPATPFMSLQTRDISFGISAPGWVVFDTINSMTSHFNYILLKPKIFINYAGYYEIVYEISIYPYSGVLNYCYFKLLDFDTQVAIPGSCGYINFTKGGADSLTVHSYKYFERGETIGFAAYPSAGGGMAATMPGSIRLSIKFIPQRGWNNNKGGQIEFKGGVMR